MPQEICLNPERLFPTPFILSDRGILRAIEQGKIKLKNPLIGNQIQPASLDVRIGKVLLYDQESRAKASEELTGLTFSEILNYEPSQKHAKVFPDQQDIPIDLPSRSFSEIYLHDHLDSIYPVSIDLRSSRGRLELQMQNFNGEYISLWNKNPNTVRLYGRSRFAQLFFHTLEDIDGHIVVNSTEAEDIGKKIGLKTYGPYVVFNLGEHAYKSKKVGLIDTKIKNNPEDTHTELIINDSLNANVEETLIAQLSPRIDLPPDIGIQILHELPYAHSAYAGFKPDTSTFLIERRCANAGWIDPGYCGNATAHIRHEKLPWEIKKGEPIALGVLFKFKEPVLRPYGHKELESNYQNSTGTISKS